MNEATLTRFDKNLLKSGRSSASSFTILKGALPVISFYMAPERILALRPETMHGTVRTAAWCLEVEDFHGYPNHFP